MVKQLFKAIIYSLLAAVALFMLYYGVVKTSPYKAVQGIMSVAFMAEQPRVIPLNGEWLDEAGQAINVDEAPGATDYFKKGTYSLLFVDVPPQTYGFHIQNCHLAKEVIVNGETAMKMNNSCLYAVTTVDSAIKLEIKWSKDHIFPVAWFTSMKFGPFSLLYTKYEQLKVWQIWFLIGQFLFTAYFFVMRKRTAYRDQYVLFAYFCLTLFVFYFVILNSSYQFVPALLMDPWMNYVSIFAMFSGVVAFHRFLGKFYELPKLNISPFYLALLFIIIFIAAFIFTIDINRIVLVTLTLLSLSSAISLPLLPGNREKKFALYVSAISIINGAILLVTTYFWGNDKGFVSYTYAFSLIFFHAILIEWRTQRDYEHVAQLSLSVRGESKEIDQLLYETSVHLQAPLQKIDRLVRDYFQASDVHHVLRKQMKFVQSINHRLMMLVNDLLDRQQMSERRFQLQKQQVPLFKLIRTITSLVHLAWRQKPIIVTVYFDEAIERVEVDEMRLSQAFHNVLDNAFKYSERGAITIRVGMERKFVVISVRDEGQGMTDEQVRNLLNERWLVMSAATNDKIGFGMGFRLTRDIVQAHSGTLTVDSVLGYGTTVTMKLPILIQMPSHSRIVTWQPERWHGEEETKHTVIVAHDERLDLSLIEIVLQQLRFVPIFVRTIEQFEYEFYRKTPQFLLLNETFTQHVVEAVRLQYRATELPIVTILDETSTDFAEEEHVNEWLRAPLDSNELKMRIETALLMKQSAKMVIDHELAAWHATIIPQYLFETMKMMEELSYEDEELFRETVQNFAIYLRAKFRQQQETQFVPLDDELMIVDAFFAVETIRLRPYLLIESTINLRWSCYVPPFLIQALAEVLLADFVARESFTVMELEVQTTEEKLVVSFVVSPSQRLALTDQQHYMFRKRIEWLLRGEIRETVDETTYCITLTLPRHVLTKGGDSDDY